MEADMTHLLLPSSAFPTDFTFLVGGKEVGAHKSILAAAHLIFGAGDGEDRVKVRSTRLHLKLFLSSGGG